mmetsp:Transcript_23930/g.74495  ORF Transcript_23930/g.74495 Transcript_23930/m.74495 type:complete len:222 (-) Transcript_23930:1377-2042(-)
MRAALRAAPWAAAVAAAAAAADAPWARLALRVLPRPELQQAGSDGLQRGGRGLCARRVAQRSPPLHFHPREAPPQTQSLVAPPPHRYPPPPPRPPQRSQLVLLPPPRPKVAWPCPCHSRASRAQSAPRRLGWGRSRAGSQSEHLAAPRPRTRRLGRCAALGCRARPRPGTPACPAPVLLASPWGRLQCHQCLGTPPPQTAQYQRHGPRRAGRGAREPRLCP